MKDKKAGHELFSELFQTNLSQHCWEGSTNKTDLVEPG